MTLLQAANRWRSVWWGWWRGEKIGVLARFWTRATYRWCDSDPLLILFTMAIHQSRRAFRMSSETTAKGRSELDSTDLFVGRAPIFCRASIMPIWAAILLLAACGGAPGFEDPPQAPSIAPPAEVAPLVPAPTPEVAPVVPAPPPPEVMPLVVADPRRGAQLFAVTPRPGLLICADCHSESPAVNNFGNIWSGRNAVALIQRAVASNTGGMGHFSTIYSATDFADIAAFLGNSPSALQFGPTAVAATSVAQVVTVSTSTKVGIENLSIKLVGEFTLAGTTCASSVPRFSSCTISVAFKPQAKGARTGAVLLNHDGTPAPVSIALSGVGL